ncbi:MAG: peptidase [Verrucomicrobiaceae bacterium]|nr:peptidase [Verrucomicrobiaceae bacterium]
MNSIPLLTLAALTGSDDNFIDHASLERPVHRNIVSAWQKLAADARAAGFDLAIASGYRNYQRQLHIWNAKVRGERAVLDTHGAPLDLSAASDWEKIQAILRWSALPGASRHHWGTDIDVYDRAAVPEGYALQLTADEASDSGPFGALHRWLDGRIAADSAHGFFRPYAEDRGGIAPERWHLSFAPLAVRYQRQLKADTLWKEIDAPTLELRETIAQHWPAIFERYIWVPALAHPEPFRERLTVDRTSNDQ